MEFDARDQALALAALPPEPPKPAAPKTSAWSAPFRALPAGVAEVGAMLAESVKGFGQALDATGTAGAGGMFGGQTDAERAQSERTRQQIRTRGLQGGSELSRSLRNVAEGYGPDPLTASKAEQVVFGLTKGVSKAIGYGMTAGPAAPLMFGLDEGLTETDRLQRQGVDNVTAGRVGMVAGGVNAAGMALPVAGATVRQTATLATLGGPASFVAQQVASREILSRADYHDIAATFDPLDPWGLALSSLPYGFGAWAMRSRMRGAPVRAPVRDQAPADGAAGVADTRPTPEPVRPVEAVPMERTPVAQAVHEAMPREVVDAAMVQHITDASQFMRVWESPPVESLASFAARTLPEVAPVRAASGPDPFLAWLRAQGGVNFADKFDITGEANAIRSNRGGVFRKAGRGIDELAQAAEAEGWLPPGTVADVDGGTPQMRDMIQRAMQGERIAPQADQFAGLEARGRAHADEMRAAEMEQRLRLLGVDPEPARGNADVLQAYLDQHEPRLLAAALAEEEGARRAAAIDDFPTPATRPPADAPPTPANRPQEASPAGLPQEPALAAIQGDPVPVFHGTKAEGIAIEQVGSTVDIGPHFTTARKTAEMFASSDGTPGLVLEGFAKFRNPLRLPDLGMWFPSDVAKAIDEARGIKAAADDQTPMQSRVWSAMEDARLAAMDALPESFQEVRGKFAGLSQEQRATLDAGMKKATDAANKAGFDMIRAELKALGHDSIVYTNTHEGDPVDTFIALASGQVKTKAADFTPAEAMRGMNLAPEVQNLVVGPQEPALPPIEPGSGPDHATIQSVRTRADQVVIEAPDLVVGRTEDGQSITAREALERIRQEAQAGTEDTLGAADAGLLDVAVQCALSLG